MIQDSETGYNVLYGHESNLLLVVELKKLYDYFRIQDLDCTWPLHLEKHMHCTVKCSVGIRHIKIESTIHLHISYLCILSKEAPRSISYTVP
jgi:hypothetical protein